MTRKQPPQKRGESRQDYRTPPEFLDALEAVHGALSFDLAATAGESVRGLPCFTAEEDALKQDWSKLGGNLWLNPPYEHIRPWAAKCAEHRNKSIRLLVPAGVDANWFWDFVRPHALVLPVHPRIRFVGEAAAYPKGLLLCLFGEFVTPGFRRWVWAQPKPRRGRRKP